MNNSMTIPDNWKLIQLGDISETTSGGTPRWWPDEIARHIGINIAISIDDLYYFGFKARGGQLVAQKLCGQEIVMVLNELNMEIIG
jgi:hypothetical protein